MEKQSSNPMRPPLQDLNNGLSRINSSSSSISSSSVSIDVPQGCLRFFRSHLSSSKTPLLRRPKSKTTTRSTPNASSSSSRSNKPSNENYLPKPNPNKKKKIPFCSEKQTFTPRTVPMSKALTNLDNLCLDSASGSDEFDRKLKDSKRDLKKLDNAGEVFEFLNGNVVENATLVSKLACGSFLDCVKYDDNNKILVEQGSSSSTKTKTPPVQASISPEIQCGSFPLDSSTSKTPNTCYAAGHVLSGITDKRKCRPRGVLTVGVGLDSSGCNIKSNVTESDDSDRHCIRVLRNSRVSLIPSPVEASMSWHLSPCHEEDGGEKGDCETSSRKEGNLIGSVTLDIPSPPLNGNNSCTFSSDVTPRGRKTRITLLSPRNFPGFSESSSDKVGGRPSSASPFSTPSKAVHSHESGKFGNNLSKDDSPFSIGSLSSGNVMQTPKSESSSEKHVSPSWLVLESSPKHHREAEIDSLVEVLGRQSLSPKSHISLVDPLGLNFRFPDLSSPSNYVDLNHIEKNLDVHDSWISDSTLENVPQSQMRISWREGLASRIFDMDELDCCRCLSDEENDAEQRSKDQLKAHQEFNVDVQNVRFSSDGIGPPEFLDLEPRVGVKVKAKSFPLRPNSCAESISTDGGGLVASGDSDWTLCYRNQLFDL